MCVCLCLFMCVSVFLLSDGLILEFFRCLAITLPVSSLSFSSLSMITYDLEALMIPLTSRLLLLSHLCDHHLNFYLFPFFPSLPLLLPPSSRPPSLPSLLLSLPPFLSLPLHPSLPPYIPKYPSLTPEFPTSW